MSKDEHLELRTLLDETHALAKENNRMLHSIRRLGYIEIVLRIFWYGLLIGFPIAAYVYVIEPYFRALGISSDQIKLFFEALPGLQSLGSIFGQ